MNGLKTIFSDLALTWSAKVEEGNDGDLTSMRYEDCLPYLANVHTKNKTALEFCNNLTSLRPRPGKHLSLSKFIRQNFACATSF